ncbi:MAG: MarR family winged helix-turn-helix transcriptional regulator [Mycobacterium sp.]
MSRREWVAGLGDVNWLNQTEERAWQGQVIVMDLLFAQIGRELTEASGLSFVDYRVLITLADSEGAKLAMSDLAASLGWSRSRISHQIKRMEARGLVYRVGNTADKRGADAYLTDHGMSVLKEAVPGQVDRVRKHYIDQLTPEQIKVLAEVYKSLLGHLQTIEEFPVPSRFESAD